eukprot:1639529-Pleurochrysis_carterae.AAC.1
MSSVMSHGRYLDMAFVVRAKLNLYLRPVLRAILPFPMRPKSVPARKAVRRASWIKNTASGRTGCWLQLVLERTRDSRNMKLKSPRC